MDFTTDQPRLGYGPLRAMCDETNARCADCGLVASGDEVCTGNYGRAICRRVICRGYRAGLVGRRGEGCCGACRELMRSVSSILDPSTSLLIMEDRVGEGVPERRRRALDFFLYASGPSGSEDRSVFGGIQDNQWPLHPFLGMVPGSGSFRSKDIYQECRRRAETYLNWFLSVGNGKRLILADQDALTLCLTNFQVLYPPWDGYRCPTMTGGMRPWRSGHPPPPVFVIADRISRPEEDEEGAEEEDAEVNLAPIDEDRTARAGASAWLGPVRLGREGTYAEQRDIEERLLLERILGDALREKIWALPARKVADELYIYTGGKAGSCSPAGTLRHRNFRTWATYKEERGTFFQLGLDNLRRPDHCTAQEWVDSRGGVYAAFRPTPASERRDVPDAWRRPEFRPPNSSERTELALTAAALWRRGPGAEVGAGRAGAPALGTPFIYPSRGGEAGRGILRTRGAAGAVGGSSAGRVHFEEVVKEYPDDDRFEEPGFGGGRVQKRKRKSPGPRRGGKRRRRRCKAGRRRLRRGSRSGRAEDSDEDSMSADDDTTPSSPRSERRGVRWRWCDGRRYPGCSGR